MSVAEAQPPRTPSELQGLAGEYYRWRDEQYPVRSSYEGLHTWDDRLTDYSAAAVAERRRQIRDLLHRVQAMQTEGWAKPDRADWLLFRSQLETVEFFDRVGRREESDPQLYVEECSNAIFSLLKKEYAPPALRARAAASRLERVPELMRQARANLKEPVRLYARLAIESARSMDSLFGASLMTLAPGLPAGVRSALERSRDAALNALAEFAEWLERGLDAMPEFSPMGEENYAYLLRHVYLLPLTPADIVMLGEAELARYRALEALLPDPSLADPDPRRNPTIPADQEAFLKAYESRQAEMVAFLREKQLVTLPPYLGQFHIRQLPEAFRPTSPGGFMNPPGLYDRDSSGFYFIPTYNPGSGNFYLRAAIEDPRPILGHEGIPGHFLQISIANHLTNEIRRQQGDGVFVEGWALYTEELFSQTGLYPGNSPSQGQVLRLSRYRAARIGVDVNLHTGRWTFEEAVRYFMEAGGLDREAAEGEAAGAASSPSQKITYMVGKWQILRLLGKYRDRAGASFRLGRFHDDLLSFGSLPVSIIEWLLLDDPTSIHKAIR